MTNKKKLVHRHTAKCHLNCSTLYITSQLRTPFIKINKLSSIYTLLVKIVCIKLVLNNNICLSSRLCLKKRKKEKKRKKNFFEVMLSPKCKWLFCFTLTKRVTILY